MMTDKQDLNVDLDDLFATARLHRPEPSSELLTRVQSDARHVQDDFLRPKPLIANRNRVFEFVRELGGWPAMAGMCSATVAGIWIGVSPPENLVTTAQGLLGVYNAEFVVDVLPDVYMGFDEGAS